MLFLVPKGLRVPTIGALKEDTKLMGSNSIREQLMRLLNDLLLHPGKRKILMQKLASW